MSEIPVTESMPRRPVYERYLQRKHHMPLDPPTEAEKRDAMRILKESMNSIGVTAPWIWMDELAVEATRILDEAGH